MAAALKRHESKRGQAPQGAGAEDTRLKRLLVDAEHDKAMLKVLVEGTSKPGTGVCAFY